ncbi:MAG: putative 7-carboxy-7-deazaguanine synthase QueE [Oscillospiraceae bacterium]|nr:putative 7-carboxy-7-deazaguanine synthase QueE [Oscillospiraceae bacterium]
MGQTYKLAEHFISINGEGQLAGELALFLRFAGCNLRCSYCDTLWACGKDAPHEVVSLSRIVDIAKDAIENGVRNVTLTGGEPLLQPGINDVIGRLTALGLQPEIETNGAIPLKDFCAPCRPKFTMDYKLPSSRMEQHMCTENFALLHEWDTVKFVCGTRADVFRAKEIAELYKPSCPLYLSPVFGQIEPAEIVEIMKEQKMTRFRLQLQLHKFIWDPMERGV